MAQSKRSEFVHGTDVTFEVSVDGAGPALIVLPSYRRNQRPSCASAEAGNDPRANQLLGTPDSPTFWVCDAENRCLPRTRGKCRAGAVW
jgi:hypothetical protein